jgi:hypothetical protein
MKTKMTVATVTQKVSISIAYPFKTRSTACSTAGVAGACPISRSTMCSCGVDRNAAHIGHGGGLGGGNALLGLGELGVELGFERLAVRVRFRRQLVARLVGDGLRAVRASASDFS